MAIPTKRTGYPLLFFRLLTTTILAKRTSSPNIAKTIIRRALPIIPFASRLMDQKVGRENKVIALWAKCMRLILRFHIMNLVNIGQRLKYNTKTLLWQFLRQKMVKRFKIKNKFCSFGLLKYIFLIIIWILYEYFLLYLMYNKIIMSIYI